MPTLTSTELGAATRFIELAGAALNNIGAQTIMAYNRPAAGGGENGAGNFIGKTPTASTAGPRFAASHNANAPRYSGGVSSTGVAGAPNRVAANSTITYDSWQHSVMTWTGSLTGTTMRYFRGIGVDITETGYTSSSNGTGAIADDSADPMYLMNRLGLDRAFVGDIAYIAIWSRVLTLPEMVDAQNNGPLNVPTGLLFVFANQQIYDPNASGITIASRSLHVDGAMPPNTALGGAADDVPVAAATLGGGRRSAESDIAEYHARRHARLKQIEVEEKKREEAKQALIAEEKRLQTKKAAKRMNEAQREKVLAKIAKYNAQIVSLDQSITKALADIKAAQEAEDIRQQQIADRRRRLLLVSLAAM